MQIQADIKKLISLLLIPLVLLLVLSTTLNYHAHMLSKGGVYVHAHPYLPSESSNPIKSDNNHSSENCFSLKHIFSFNLVFFISVGVFVSQLYFLINDDIYITSFKVCNLSLLLPNRAPPIF